MYSTKKQKSPTCCPTLKEKPQVFRNIKSLVRFSVRELLMEEDIQSSDSWVSCALARIVSDWKCLSRGFQLGPESLNPRFFGCKKVFPFHACFFGFCGLEILDDDSQEINLYWKDQRDSHFIFWWWHFNISFPEGWVARTQFLKNQKVYDAWPSPDPSAENAAQRSSRSRMIAVVIVQPMKIF